MSSFYSGILPTVDGIDWENVNVKMALLHTPTDSDKAIVALASSFKDIVPYIIEDQHHCTSLRNKQFKNGTLFADNVKITTIRDVLKITHIAYFIDPDKDNVDGLPADANTEKGTVELVGFINQFFEGGSLDTVGDVNVIWDIKNGVFTP